MAYTSIIPVRRLDNSIGYVQDKNKTTVKNQTLENAIDYAFNREKTEQDVFETAVNCTINNAFSDMMLTKKMWRNNDGVQGYHLVQSFAEGEVTPELAHKIGIELAQQITKNNFEAVVATHLNTYCFHNHIVFNSVSFVNGKKYRSNAKSYYTQVRQISDTLCKKYGLSVILTQSDEKNSKPYIEWQSDKNGQPTWRTAIRQDISEAITAAMTWKQFVRNLENKGYELRFNRKYPVLKPPGKERFVRFKTLGVSYTPEAIAQRILYPKQKMKKQYLQQSYPKKLLINGKPIRKTTGLQALYFHYLYKLGAFQRKPKYTPYSIRQDIYKLEKRIIQLDFITSNAITTTDELVQLRKTKEKELVPLIDTRLKLYHQKATQTQLVPIAEKVKKLRKEIKMCQNIQLQSVEMAQRLREIERDKKQVINEHTKKKERNQYAK